MKTLLKNGYIFVNDKFIKKDLIISGNNIEKFITNENIDENAYKVIDCKNKYITPTFIDSHVHTRIPGLEYKEDLDHFVNGCLKGGILEVIAMGNVIPNPDCIHNYEIVENALKNDYVKIHQVATVTKGIRGKELTNFEELSKKTKLFSDDGAPLFDADIMLKAIERAKKNNCILLLHEESRIDNINHGYMYDGQYAIKKGHRYFFKEYETNIIKRDINLNKQINAHIHVQHLSTSEGIDIIEQANKAGIKVTTEVTPHHLILSTDDIKSEDGNYKMNPPLGKPEWRDNLVNAVNERKIKIIGSDHAPHTDKEKSRGLSSSAFGIIGTEIMLPTLYTYLVKNNKIPLEIIISCLTKGPAEILLNKTNDIKVGGLANLNIISFDKAFILTKENILSKSKNTPFLNKKLWGMVEKVFKNGKIIYSQN